MSNDLLVEPWPAPLVGISQGPASVPFSGNAPDLPPYLPGLRADNTSAVDEAVARLSPTSVVNQLVSKMNEPPNKFAELALRSAAIRKENDARADRLAKRLDAIPALADATFGKHERMLDETEEGIQALEDSLRDMTGHNSK